MWRPSLRSKKRWRQSKRLDRPRFAWYSKQSRWYRSQREADVPIRKSSIWNGDDYCELSVCTGQASVLRDRPRARHTQHRDKLAERDKTGDRNSADPENSDYY